MSKWQVELGFGEVSKLFQIFFGNGFVELDEFAIEFLIALSLAAMPQKTMSKSGYNTSGRIMALIFVLEGT